MKSHTIKRITSGLLVLCLTLAPVPNQRLGY